MVRARILSNVLLLLTILSGAILSSTVASADSAVIDRLTVDVPVSCSMSGVGMNSHNANIRNMAYNSQIGETSINVLCNDSSGFAIYAIGFTDDIEGKNVLAASTLDSSKDIATGTGTSGDSQWAMKLTAVTNPTPVYPASIENGFDSFHTVPTEYTMVAKSLAGTDVGSGATGANLTTTYQVYIGEHQPPDTYVGQVKYVLVHPSTAAAPLKEGQFAIDYEGNGLTFDGGGSVNRVVYGVNCSTMYMDTEPGDMVETPNFEDGEWTGVYEPTEDESIYKLVYLEGASKVRVVVDYGLTADADILIVGDDWSGWEDARDPYELEYKEIYTMDEETGDAINISDTVTYDFDGDTVAISIDLWGEPEEGDDEYGYGVRAFFYPVYETAGPDLEEISVCSYGVQTGDYETPTTWNGKWFTVMDGEIEWFEDEDDETIMKYIINEKPELIGSNLTFYAYNPHRIYYDGNGATAGTMSSYYTLVNTNLAIEKTGLMAGNFARTNYGFAGWSEDPNATVNSNAKIYGPNEAVPGGELTYDNNRETTLYAVWVPKSTTMTMQNFSCSSLASLEVIALEDTRDHNVYTVGKMQDGVCWMMENLRLGTYGSDDESKSQKFGGYFVGLADSEDTNFSNTSQGFNSLYNMTIITGSNTSNRYPRYNGNNTNIGGTNALGVTLVATPGLWETEEEGWTSEEGNDNHSQWYSYGNYYTWAAAMASTSNMTTTSASEEAGTSICPHGWSLPYGSTTGNGAQAGGISYLDILLGGNGGIYQEDQGVSTSYYAWRSYPNNFVLSGEYSGSRAFDRGMVGIYWTQTARASIDAYAYCIGNYIQPGDALGSKFRGHGVRCISY